MEKKVTFEIEFERLEKLLKTRKSKRGKGKIKVSNVFAERVTNIIEWGDAEDLNDAIIQGLWLLSEKSYKKNCTPIPNLSACTPS